jgi:hypothetical protein
MHHARDLLNKSAPFQENPLDLHLEILRLLREVYGNDREATWRAAAKSIFDEPVRMAKASTEQLVRFRDELRSRAEALREASS